MPVTKKEARKGTQLLVDGDVLDEARAIAVVREVSVAEVWRDAIDLHLQSLENAEQLDKLDDWLGQLDVNRSKALEWMVKHGINFDVLAADEKMTAAMIDGIKARKVEQ